MGKRRQGNDAEGGGGGKRKKGGFFSTVLSLAAVIHTYLAFPHVICDETFEAHAQNTKASLPKCRGFLVSCWSGKEQQAAREAMDVLQEVNSSLPHTCRY